VKSFILILIFMISFGATARGPGDSPTPFPLGQAPEDMVGKWNNLVKDEVIFITYIRNSQIAKAKLFASVFTGGHKSSQGYLYFNGEMFCGPMRKTSGGRYNLCVWKERGLLKTATYTDSEWGTFRYGLPFWNAAQ